MALDPQLTIRVAANLAEFKKNLAEGKDQIETTTTAMQKLVNSFDGSKIIQSAHNVVAAVNEVGGASRLTEAEQARVNATLQKALDKYALLGKEPPAAMRALADATKQADVAATNLEPKTQSLLDKYRALLPAITAAGVALAVKSWTNAASEINDLAQKTGISTTAIQEMKFAADQSGSSLDQVSTAAVMMSKNIAGGNASAVSALSDLNLKFSDIRSLNPGDAFFKIAAAIAQVPDPMKRAQLATELFGRSGADLLPMIGNMDELRQKAHDLGIVMSEETVKSGDDLGDAFDALLAVGKNLIGVVIAPMAPLLTALAGALSHAAGWVTKLTGGFFEWLGSAGHIKQTLADIADTLERLGLKASQVPPAAGAATKSLAALKVAADAQAFQATAVSVEDMAIEFNRMDAAAKPATKSLTALRKEVDATLKSTTQLEIHAAVLSDFRMPTLGDAADQARNMLEGLTADGLIPATDRTIGLADAFPPLVDGMKKADAPARTLTDSLKSLAHLDFGQVFKDLGGFLKGGLSSIGTGILEGFGQSLMSGISTLIGKGISAIGGGLKKLFGIGNEGRKMVEEFAASQGGFDALHDKLLQTGQAGEQLWIKLTQGVGRNNKDEAKAAIDEVSAALDNLAAKPQRMADAVAQLGQGIAGTLAPLSQQAATMADNIVAAQAKLDAATTKPEADKAAKRLNDLIQERGKLANASAAELQRMSDITLAGFNAAIAQGASYTTALQNVAPALQTINQIQTDLGVTSQNTAVQELLDLQARIDKYPQLTGAVDSYNQVLQASANLGIINADSIGSFAAQAVSMYDQMIAKGFTQQQTLQMMAPTLQALESQYAKLGVPIDDATQKILDQAHAQGVLSAEGQSTNNILIDGLSAVISAVGGELPKAWRKFGSEAQTQAGKAGSAIDSKVIPIVGDLDQQLKAQKWAQWSSTGSGAGDTVKNKLLEASQAAGNIDSELGAIEWDDFKVAGVNAAKYVERALDKVAYGNSPTGIAGVREQLKFMGDDFEREARRSRDAIDDLYEATNDWLDVFGILEQKLGLTESQIKERYSDRWIEEAFRSIRGGNRDFVIGDGRRGDRDGDRPIVVHGPSMPSRFVVRIGQRDFEGYIEDTVTKGTANGRVRVDKRSVTQVR